MGDSIRLRDRSAPAALRRRLVSALAGAALAASALAVTALPIAGGHARPALAATSLVAPDEASALAMAVSAGQPVEALSDRTEFAQAFVNPDASMTENVSAAQQRVQLADGTWAVIDTRLQPQADGTIAPAASPVRSALSSGGTGPALTVWQDDSWGGGTLAMTWDGGALPAPALFGDTATYAGVLSGVDLQVTSTDQGADLALVVNSAQAAANLTTFGLDLSAPGMTLSADAAGDVTATDSLGGDAFDVSAPRMWDSATGASGPSGPGANVLEGSAAAQLSGGTLTVTPDQGMLAAAGTVFPVFVGVHVNPREPSVTVHGPRGGWLAVAQDNTGAQWGQWEPHGKLFSNGANQELAPVGPWCNDDGNGNCVSGYRGEQRSYLNFPVPSRIWDSPSNTISATLFTNDVWTWSCSAPTQVELWQSKTAAKPGMNWTTAPAEQIQLSTSAGIDFGNRCPAKGVKFDATAAAIYAAAAHSDTLTFELKATTTDETNYNVFARKIFSVSQNSDPFLQIHYDHPPDMPTNTQVLDGSRVFLCSQSSPIFISTRAPTLRATISDPDGIFSGDINALFPWAEVGTGSPSGTPKTSALKPGSQFATQLSGLPDDRYRWQAQGIDAANVIGKRSSACDFHVDTSAPAPPGITPSQSTVTIGAVSQFTFSDPANRDPTDHVNDVVGYRYGFSNPPVNYVPANHEGGTAAVPISPVWLGTRTLYVLAVDRAGNVSTAATPGKATITSTRPTGNPTPLLAWWKLDEGGTATTALDATLHGHGAHLGAGATWSSMAARTAPPCASIATALSLGGASDSEASTASQIPPVDNTGSFTVSACVKLSSCVSTVLTCSVFAPVSMDGITQSAFALEYRDKAHCQAGAGNGSTGCWAFTMPTSDATNATSSTVYATTPVAFNTWVQLTAVYDQVHQTMAISVNGVLAALNGVAVGGVMPWSGPAMGPLRMGRALSNGSAVDWWPGDIADVCVFWGALDTAQVGSVYSNGCGSAGPP